MKLREKIYLTTPNLQDVYFIWMICGCGHLVLAATTLDTVAGRLFQIHLIASSQTYRGAQLHKVRSHRGADAAAGTCSNDFRK